MNKQRIRVPIVIALLGLGGLSGCASMSQEECRLADWYTVGYEDGVRGNSGDRIGQHREACAEHGIAPDFQAYQSGREAGLREFCRPANGFRLGSGGRNYNGVCPGDLESEFLTAHQDGRHLYRLQSRVNTIEATIDNRHGEIDGLKQTLSQDEALVIASDTSREDRVLLLKEMWDLAKRQGELEEEIQNLEIERARRIQELENYRSEIANLY
jgi:hypothetical protein